MNKKEKKYSKDWENMKRQSELKKTGCNMTISQDMSSVKMLMLTNRESIEHIIKVMLSNSNTKWHTLVKPSICIKEASSPSRFLHFSCPNKHTLKHTNIWEHHNKFSHSNTHYSNTLLTITSLHKWCPTYLNILI